MPAGSGLNVQRVWVNTSEVNSSFVDYTWRGSKRRMVVEPLCGLRLPKDVEAVDGTGHGMREVIAGAAE